MSAGIVPGTTSVLDPGTPGGAGSSGVSLGTGTGQHGSIGVTGMGNSNPLVTLWQWLNEPFTTAMSATDVFLLIGVIAVSLIAWNLILMHIRIAAEAI